MIQERTQETLKHLRIWGLIWGYLLSTVIVVIGAIRFGGPGWGVWLIGLLVGALAQVALATARQHQGDLPLWDLTLGFLTIRFEWLTMGWLVATIVSIILIVIGIGQTWAWW